jgi:predicted TIM-barrel fold metal-dependent hydrolase
MIVDADAHISISQGIKAIFPYMQEPWQKWFTVKKVQLPPSGDIGGNPLGLSGGRDDARPPNGGPAGSDPEFMRTDLLDKWGIDVAILNSVASTYVATGQKGGSTDESIVLCSAINDYYLKEWITVDKRYRYNLIVPTRDPLAAAKEIHRCANNSAVAAIQLATLDILIGNRYYYPIYEAAAQHNLPIYVQLGALPDFKSITDTYLERMNSLPSGAIMHLTSALFSGIFQAYPALKFVFAEFGFTWVPPILWHIDNDWTALRTETPWLDKPPSEYVHGHIWLTSQPVPTSRRPNEINKLVEILGDDLILFGTGYPHWNSDTPSHPFFMRSEESRNRIFSENASKVFRI